MSHRFHWSSGSNSLRSVQDAWFRGRRYNGLVVPKATDGAYSYEQDCISTAPTRSQHKEAARRSEIGSDGLSMVTPTFGFLGSWEERRVFNVFRVRVADQMSGHFDGFFWKAIVLQAAHRENPVRHAVLALSSLAERLECGELPKDLAAKDVEEGIFALHHYNQAICELNALAERHELSLDVCLVTCLLFVFIEVGPISNL